MRWVVFMLACAPPLHIAAPPPTPITAAAESAQDTAPREQLRLMPAEVYLRSYLLLMSAASPMDAEKRGRGDNGGALFDNWNDYLATLGFPDYRNDLPRATQTNALMVAAFERLGIALCDRAVEHDLRSPLPQRTLFAFEVKTPLDEAGFAERFDILHRSFLGYPAKLAPEGRIKSYFSLYQSILERHKKSKLSSEEAAWAGVCYGLIRHPEYHLY